MIRARLVIALIFSTFLLLGGTHQGHALPVWPESTQYQGQEHKTAAVDARTSSLRLDSSSLALAVVRLPSHGASATIIETRRGRTLLLGCGHAFAGLGRRKPLVADVPASHPVDVPKRAGVHLLDVDYDLDLSLVVVDDGPMEFSVAVADPGHTPGPHLLSVGYDEMLWPAQSNAVHLAALTSIVTFTWERPRHGRSGGGLFDVDAGCLIGVVQGYELTAPGRGMYVSHAAILRFLARQQANHCPFRAPGRLEFSSPLPQLCPI